jgi:polyisoprenyl-phosphate glycosyltransferase
MRERLRFFGGLVDWLGFPTASVDVEHAPRHSGRTAYTFRKLFKLAADTIIAHSDKPLRLSVKFGFLMSAVSFGAGVWLTARALVNGSAVMGWPSLIVSLYFLGGIIIAILGVIGIYLGKAFDEAKKRPLYVVSESTFLHE